MKKPNFFIQSLLGKRVLIVISFAGLFGCQGQLPWLPPGESSLQHQPGIPKHTHELAGPWEYQDESGSGILVLDQSGKGGYDWKEGWFETDSLEDGVWKGRWYQAENDREGGFEVRFTIQSPMVPGRWWYSRIGKDTDPLEPGGTMTMRRPVSFLHSGK